MSFHRDVQKKDIAKLSKQDQESVEATIAALSSGVQNLQTHKLTQPLTGWFSTKASRGHRIVHRPDPDVPGGIEIGYVGLHDYGKAINRLTKRLGGLRGPVPSDLVVRRVPLAAPLAGGAFGRLVAARGNEAQGFLDYGLDQRRSRIFLHAVAVSPQVRRRGVASTLLAALQREFPGYAVDPGYTSDSGEAWWQSASGRKVAIKVGVMNRKVRVNGMDQVLCPQHYGESSAESDVFSLPHVHQGLTEDGCTRCGQEHRKNELFARHNTWLDTYMSHSMKPLPVHRNPDGKPTGMLLSQCSDCGAQAFFGPHVTMSGGTAENRNCAPQAAKTASIWDGWDPNKRVALRIDRKAAAYAGTRYE